LSLIEIMVGMVIGVLAIIIMMQVFADSEATKRTTTGTADAQTTGNIAIFTMERDVRLAGFSFADSQVLNCTVTAHDTARAAGAQQFTWQLVPVLITHGDDGAPDTVTVNYGSANVMVPGQDFTEASTVDMEYVVGNRAGYNASDIVVATAAGLGCTMAEITALPAGTGQLMRGTGNYVNAAGQTVTARHNKAGGLGTTYTTGTIHNLGPQPRSNVYTIRLGQFLAVRDELNYTDTDGDNANDDVSIADGVVQLQAQYGIDANNDGAVSEAEFTDAQPADTTAWGRLRAIRFGLLTRVGQYEKTSVTNAAPQWNGGEFTMVDPGDGTSWRNYRYRVIQTVVPLRNMIWGRS
jgi:type IV pilus assembly protein PilW